MCRLPLYQQAQHADLGSVAIQSGNAGLYFTRFYNQYTDGQLQGEYGAKNEEGKNKFLIKFANVVGQLEQLEQYTFRQITLMDAIGGSARLYGLNGHFVTGMGYEHPVENGFQWHYTLGVPYLAGSQVKGMVRSMIERYLDDSADNKAALLLKWFGSTDKDPQKKGDQSQAGELIFFDALPYKKPILTIDVMTPHMGDWYAKGGNIQNPQDSDKIPADWHDPVPIPFLTVKDAQFVFSIGKREGSNIDLGDVWDVLDQALTYLGAGGKTNTGFGYMHEDVSGTKELLSIFSEYKSEEKLKSEISSLNKNKRLICLFKHELLKLEKSRWKNKPNEVININIDGSNYWFLEIFNQVASWESKEDKKYALDELFLPYLPEFLGKDINKHKKWKDRINSIK